MHPAPLAAVPGITAVISTFNRARYLGEALESLLHQTLPLQRIVVVDDGSTDDTAAVAAAYAPQVEYVKLENGGKARALNHALPGVQTEFVWFFDDDDEALPDAAQVMAAAAAAHPQAAFVFGDHDLVWADGPLSQPTRVVPRPYPFAHELPALQRLRLFRECTVMMTGALLRTEAVRAAGGLKPEMLACEDYELLVRLAAEHPFAYAGGKVYLWRQHGGVRRVGQSTYDSGARLKFWARFNEPIGRLLLDVVPLTRFQTEEQDDLETPSARRAALLARAWAVGPKLPVETGVRALTDALKAAPDAPLTEQELEMVREAFNHAFVGLRPARPLYRLMGLLRLRYGAQALVEVARGLYWLSRSKSRVFDRVRWMFVAGCLFAAAASQRWRGARQAPAADPEGGRRSTPRG